MSTTFVIVKDGQEIEIAHRSNWICWKNPLAELLPDNTKVYPIDNTPQGIFTIGDIKKQIQEREKC